MADHSTQTFAGEDGYPLVSLVTYALAGVAWVLLALGDRLFPVSESDGGSHMSHTHAAHSHSSSAGGFADPGVPEAAAVTGGVSGIALYLLAWGLMIAAMMYPSSARVFQAYADSIESAPTDGGSSRVAVVAPDTPVWVLIGTYTLVWVLIGLVPLAVALLVPIASLAARGSAFFGGALVVLSAYQLSPYKEHCLERCRSPSEVRLPNRLTGIGSTTRFALDVSRDDVGTCWVWMGFMVLVGSANLIWMAAITALLTVEQVAPRGTQLAKAFGIVSLVVGLGMLVQAIG